MNLFIKSQQGNILTPLNKPILFDIYSHSILYKDEDCELGYFDDWRELKQVERNLFKWINKPDSNIFSIPKSGTVELDDDLKNKNKYGGGKM